MKVSPNRGLRVVIHNPGGYEELKIEEFEIPEPKEG